MGSRGPELRSSSLTYMPAIDGLRTVAVGLVVFIHVLPTTTFPGEIGVDVFFVISGFLITLILLKQLARTETIALGRFYANRALRLYPPLLVVVLFTVVVGVFPGQSLGESLKGAAIALLYLGNIYMTVTGSWLGDLSHTWSLAMEEQFYLVWPAILLLLYRKRARVPAIATGLFLIAGLMLVGWMLTGDEMQFNPLTRGVGLVIGCALAVLTRENHWYSPALSTAGAIVFVAALVLVTAGYLPHLAMTPIAVLSVAPIVLQLAYGRGLPTRVLSLPPVVYLGVISYEIYLWHYPILAVLFRGTALPGWAIAGVGIAATLILSVATHRYISAPVLRWRDRRRGRAAPAS